MMKDVDKTHFHTYPTEKAINKFSSFSILSRKVANSVFPELTWRVNDELSVVDVSLDNNLTFSN